MKHLGTVVLVVIVAGMATEAFSGPPCSLQFSHGQVDADFGFSIPHVREVCGDRSRLIAAAAVELPPEVRMSVPPNEDQARAAANQAWYRREIDVAQRTRGGSHTLPRAAGVFWAAAYNEPRTFDVGIGTATVGAIPLVDSDLDVDPGEVLVWDVDLSEWPDSFSVEHRRIEVKPRVQELELSAILSDWEFVDGRFGRW